MEKKEGGGGGESGGMASGLPLVVTMNRLP
jgi:hypothetical protein